MGATPFEVLYGHSPRHFGLSTDDSLPSSDAQLWLQQRAVVQEAARQHLLCGKQRMKNQADKNRKERQFVVGDRVFLKLQPYAQASVIRRASHKLAFKFLGPYQVLQNIVTVAYRLELPSTSRIHPVFHISQLKPFVPPTQQVHAQLPSPDTEFPIPVQVLQQRRIQRGATSVEQVLVRWSDSTAELATWEDKESLRQQFPRAPAWGQAVSKEAGIVSIPIRQQSVVDEVGRNSNDDGPRKREARTKKLPARLADPVWVRE